MRHRGADLRVPLPTAAAPGAHQGLGEPNDPHKQKLFFHNLFNKYDILAHTKTRLLHAAKIFAFRRVTGARMQSSGSARGHFLE